MYLTHCFSFFYTGEVDTRFSFCAVACLALLGRLEAIDTDKAVEFVLSCMNFDGGFGCRPGSESHSGQVRNNALFSKFKVCKVRSLVPCLHNIGLSYNIIENIQCFVNQSADVYLKQ